MERKILHVDVNNAFLSWTALERLKRGEKIDIRNIASAICGDENRRAGIILAKSKLAKDMGVVTRRNLVSSNKKMPEFKNISN